MSLITREPSGCKLLGEGTNPIVQGLGQALFFFKPSRKTPVIRRCDIVKEGWLEKQSIYARQYKRRWCVLTRHHLCSFESDSGGYRNPTEFLRLRECSQVAAADSDTSRQHSFRVDSADRTFYLVAASAGDRDAWVTHTLQQFTYEWEPVVKGAKMPEGVLEVDSASGTERDGVARNQRGESGRLLIKDGRVGDICCHHQGRSDRGDALVAKQGATVKWQQIARGVPVPDGAVFVGRSRQDGEVFVARNSKGVLGKLNIIDGCMWNIWCHEDARQAPANLEGEILVLEPPVLEDPSGELEPSPSGSAPSAADELLASLEPCSRDGATFSWWSSQVEEQLKKGGDLGPCFGSPPEESILGKGTFGCVWLAQDKNSREAFAVKNMMVKGGAPGNALEKVARNELKVAERIRANPHAFIVSLFLVEQFSLARSTLFMLVMEFCPGGDLQQSIEEGILKDEYKPPEKIFTWIGQIFLALEHLHTKVDALIRDLKPGNVVLSRSSSAKLTDFGYGRIIPQSDGTWSFGAPPGSPGYVAPEVLCQEPYDYHADLYSFGAMLWVMLTGGWKGIKEPVPPMGKGGDYNSYKQDWSRLAQCLQKPENGRRAPPEEAVPLISELTQRKPSERPSHQQVRDSILFRRLQLPDADAEPGCVKAWRYPPVSSPMAKQPVERMNGEATTSRFADDQPPVKTILPIESPPVKTILPKAEASGGYAQSETPSQPDM